MELLLYSYIQKLTWTYGNMEELTEIEKMALVVAINHFKQSLDNGTLVMDANTLITNDAWKTWVDSTSTKLKLPKTIK